MVILSVALSLALVACEPLVTIRVQNQTTEILKIFNDGEVFVGNASPGEEVKFQIESIYPKYKIIAKDIDGNIVYSTSFTREDVSGNRTYTVIIQGIGIGEQRGSTTALALAELLTFVIGGFLMGLILFVLGKLSGRLRVRRRFLVMFVGLAEFVILLAGFASGSVITLPYLVFSVLIPLFCAIATYFALGMAGRIGIKKKRESSQAKTGNPPPSKLK